MELWRACLLLVVLVAIAGCVDSSSEAVRDEVVTEEFQDGFVEEEVKYGDIESLTDVDGELAYIGLTTNEAGLWNESFIGFGGERLAEDYLVKPISNDMNTPLSVDGSLAYWASDGGDEFVVVDGEEGKRHSSVSRLSEIKGKLAYRAVDSESSENESDASDDADIIEAPEFGDFEEFTVYDGQRLADQVEDTPVSFPREVDGELTFVAERSDRWFIVHGGEEVGRQYVNATAPRGVNGTLAYKAVTDAGEVLVYDGEAVRGPVNRIDMDSVTAVGGDPAVVVENDGEQFIAFQGEEWGRAYDQMSDPIDVGGRLGYTAENWTGEPPLGDREAVSYKVDGESFGEEYDHIVWAGAVVSGEPAYLVQDLEEQEMFVVVGEREEPRYPSIYIEPIREIDGELTYTGVDGREAIVVHGGKEIRNGYNEILAGPIEVGEKLVFAAERDSSTYIVRE